MSLLSCKGKTMASYNGYLLKIGGRTIPNKYIQYDSYTIQPNQRQDLDPYRDLDGVLHRNVVRNMPSVIKFNTKPMFEEDMQAFMGIINGGFSNRDERKGSIQYYDFETFSYKTGDFYMAQPEFTIHYIWELRKRRMLFDAMAIEFIGY